MNYGVMERPIMKSYRVHRSRKREMMQDAFVVLGPPILTLIGILWFFSKERIPMQVTRVLMSYVDSFLALLTNAS